MKSSLIRLLACLGAGLLFEHFVLKNFLPFKIKADQNHDHLTPEQALSVGQGGSFIWKEGVILCHVSARVDCLTKLGRNKLIWFSDGESPHDIWRASSSPASSSTSPFQLDEFYMIVERGFGRPDGAPYFEDIWNYARDLKWEVLALQKWDRIPVETDSEICCAKDWAIIKAANGTDSSTPSPISIWRGSARGNPWRAQRAMIRLLRPSIFFERSTEEDRGELVRFHQHARP